jgi:hypothetical protein
MNRCDENNVSSVLMACYCWWGIRLCHQCMNGGFCRNLFEICSIPRYYTAFTYILTYIHTLLTYLLYLLTYLLTYSIKLSPSWEANRFAASQEIHHFYGTQCSLRLTTDWTVRGSNPIGSEIFHTRPDRPWGPPSFLYNGYRVFSGGKAAWAWCWPLTPS